MRRDGEGERGTDEARLLAQGNSLLMFLLDSVRLGSRSNIEAAFSDPKNAELGDLIIGRRMPLANLAFQYLLPQIIYAAVSGGMSWVEATEKYYCYAEKAKQSETARDLLDLYKQMFLDFAESVARVNRQFVSWVRRCRTYVSQHIHEPLSVRQIAEALGISRSYLSHLYKDETGETITDYIQREKISEAQQLLQYSELSSTAIAYQLGYCSHSHFIDTFHKATGLTPSQFRNRHRQRQSVR